MKRPYRPGMFVWVSRVFAALVCVLTPPLVLVNLFNSTDEAGRSLSPAMRLGNSFAMLLILGGLAALPWGMTRAGIYVEGDVVVVKGLLRTWSYRWSDIAGFDDMAVRDLHGRIAKRFVARNGRCVRLRLTDGRAIPVRSVNSGSTLLGSKPAEIARRLEAARPIR